MRIRRKAAALSQFAAEILQLFGRKAPFQESARVNAGCGVALEVNRIAFKLVVARTEEMIESHFKQRRHRAVGRDMPADAVLFAVGAHHHGQRVPADQAFDPPLDLLVARQRHLLAHVNGVHVRRIRGERDLHTAGERSTSKFLQNPGREPGFPVLYNRVE